MFCYVYNCPKAKVNRRSSRGFLSRWRIGVSTRLFRFTFRVGRLQTTGDGQIGQLFIAVGGQLSRTRHVDAVVQHYKYKVSMTDHQICRMTQSWHVTFTESYKHKSTVRHLVQLQATWKQKPNHYRAAVETPRNGKRNNHRHVVRGLEAGIRSAGACSTHGVGIHCCVAENRACISRWFSLFVHTRKAHVWWTRDAMPPSSGGRLCEK